ncbi:uncharacterized protein LOC133036924 [Cannabis sativa]|uniref:uncharacterized protein LOC133036924 n=1 Tax=Cannabis sativa TaxID=3483 RepID=UPI0029CAA792|nr:uncharacterized protein LOC133036924 [Cannabis sativa]
MTRKAARYIIVEGVMYRRGFSMPLLRCVTKEEVARILSKVHKGLCGNHAVGQSLSKKILRLLHKIVSNNGKQFDSQMFIDFSTHGTIKSFSAVAHPQTDGQAAVNKTLKDTMKKELEEAKENWPEALP